MSNVRTPGVRLYDLVCIYKPYIYIRLTCQGGSIKLASTFALMPCSDAFLQSLIAQTALTVLTAFMVGDWNSNKNENKKIQIKHWQSKISIDHVRRNDFINKNFYNFRQIKRVFHANEKGLYKQCQYPWNKHTIFCTIIIDVQRTYSINPNIFHSDFQMDRIISRRHFVVKGISSGKKISSFSHHFRRRNI